MGRKRKDFLLQKIEKQFENKPNIGVAAFINIQFNENNFFSGLHFVYITRSNKLHLWLDSNQYNAMFSCLNL